MHIGAGLFWRRLRLLNCSGSSYALGTDVDWTVLHIAVTILEGKRETKVSILVTSTKN